MALYTREASQINALRTVNAKHKHMEMLLLDRLQVRPRPRPERLKPHFQWKRRRQKPDESPYVEASYPMHSAPALCVCECVRRLPGTRAAPALARRAVRLARGAKAHPTVPHSAYSSLTTTLL